MCFIHVSLVSYDVLVNGFPNDLFPAAWGLRQGCSLSLLLFLLVIEELNRLIDKSKLDGSTKGISFSKNLSISHLLFVDNIMIFGLGSLNECRAYHSLIMNFCYVLRLSINIKKHPY